MIGRHFVSELQLKEGPVQDDVRVVNLIRKQFTGRLQLRDERAAPEARRLIEHQGFEDFGCDAIGDAGNHLEGFRGNPEAAEIASGNGDVAFFREPPVQDPDQSPVPLNGYDLPAFSRQGSRYRPFPGADIQDQIVPANIGKTDRIGYQFSVDGEMLSREAHGNPVLFHATLSLR